MVVKKYYSKKCNPEGSYFETSSSHQKKIQTAIIEKNKNQGQLAEKLADAAHLLASQFFTEVGPSFKTDCKKQCSYCCYQVATVFPFEAIRIAQELKNTLDDHQLESLKVKMRDRVRNLKNVSVQKNVNNKDACPLLVNEQCSVYKHRPLTCRMAHSFSVNKCRVSFQGDRTKVEVPMSLELLTGISGIIEGAYEELPKSKLDSNLYELCSAVLVALTDNTSSVKWANGDRRVFMNCIKDDT